MVSSPESEPNVQPTETTIATVEVRHASYLRLLNGEVPFPEPFDDPRAPRRICEMVDQFINRSSFDLKAFCESLPKRVITI